MLRALSFHRLSSEDIVGGFVVLIVAVIILASALNLFTVSGSVSGTVSLVSYNITYLGERVVHNRLLYLIWMGRVVLVSELISIVLYLIYITGFLRSKLLYYAVLLLQYFNFSLAISITNAVKSVILEIGSVSRIYTGIGIIELDTVSLRPSIVGQILILLSSGSISLIVLLGFAVLVGILTAIKEEKTS